MDAHRLLRWAKIEGKQTEIAESLFMAYWSNGLDIGDHNVIANLAAAHSMDGAVVLSALASDQDKNEVLMETQQAQKFSITGVPTYIINRKYGLVGAQDAEVLANQIKQVATH